MPLLPVTIDGVPRVPPEKFTVTPAVTVPSSVTLTRMTLGRVCPTVSV